MFGNLGLKKAAIGVAVIVGGALVIDGYVDSPNKSVAAGHTSSSDHSTSSASGSARVASGVSLAERAHPTTSASRVGMLAPGATLSIACLATGQSISGDTQWYRLSDGAYVAGKYVTAAGSTHRC